MSHQNFTNTLEKASGVIGKTWPLYSFVTSNPLSGYERSPFAKALENAEDLLGANVYPDASLYRQAWNNGEIERNVLLKGLRKNGISEAPELCLQIIESEKRQGEKNTFHELDSLMAKWLACFMDEGLAEWPMPGRKKGFYKAWRKVAKYDDELAFCDLSIIAENSELALSNILMTYYDDEILEIFQIHLAALPGWTGYIKYRMESNSGWQQKYPISLQDYMAVRLTIANEMGLMLLPQKLKSKKDQRISKMQLVWLKAWEQSWQQKLIHILEENSLNAEASDKKLPRAQMVFCIDTRSELIRRHVEAAGNYETFGYAGFFGIAMDYVDIKDGLSRKSCPPIVGSAYKVSEIAQPNREQEWLKFQQENKLEGFKRYFLKRMKHMLPSAFGFVEGSGIVYGASLLARTFLPGYMYRSKNRQHGNAESFCETDMKRNQPGSEISGIGIEEKVAIVKSAFDLLGWKDFAPLVIFTGHGSHSANNAFASSLDCGACAASPGRNNARMLAKLANLEQVREILKTRHQIKIPEETVFVGAEHNTTTDEIVLFDAQVPESHRTQLEKLKKDLQNAQNTASRERLKFEGNAKARAEAKANNWSETRPEWGLAKNAGFIVGPRSLTENTNLDSRCFLHSYNWEMDKEGKALEGIMQGPMVVTQWINNHYYFSSVDNDSFGGGNKITHNITGRFGVLQGNGGDLKMGLPLQSLKQTDEEMYHQPLRLSVMIQAPVERIADILERNENLKTMLNNEWIYLLAMDPLKDNKIFKYSKNMKWKDASEKKTIKAQPSKKTMKLATTM